MYYLLIFFAAAYVCGFILFSKAGSSKLKGHYNGKDRVSVIIPARNEEKNLPNILESIKLQTYVPYEVIVVDDFSSDRTAEIAGQYDVKLIHNKELPEGWTGKTWAVWNGYLHSSGEILLFLDADVRLSPGALEALLTAREKAGGVISVVPYHIMEKFYEKLSLVSYLLGVFAFISPFEKGRRKKALYGACIMTGRDNYEKTGGHNCIRSEILDDINLGKQFSKAGIRIENYIGNGLVSFRMYPYGIRGELQGFSKGALNATSQLKTGTTVMIGVWVSGLIIAGLSAPVFLVMAAVSAAFTEPASFVAFDYSLAAVFLSGYVAYSAQILYFMRHTGRYGIIMPLLHFLPSLFFICVLASSFYQLHFVGAVTWKGRQVLIRSIDKVKGLRKKQE